MNEQDYRETKNRLSNYQKEIKFLESLGELENSLVNYNTMIIKLLEKEEECKGSPEVLNNLKYEREKLEELAINVQYKIKRNEIYLNAIDGAYREVLKYRFIKKLYVHTVCNLSYISTSTLRRYILAGLEQLRIALKNSTNNNICNSISENCNCK